MKMTLNVTLAAGALLSWSAAASAQEFYPIEPLPGHVSVSVTGVSGDGSVVVGTSRGDGGAFDTTAFVWTVKTGTVGLPFFGSYARGEAISADGNTVVGFSSGQGVRWVNGAIEALDTNAQVPFVYPVSVSGDGNVITGEGEGDAGLIAFRWTPTSLVNIGSVLPNDYEILGTAVSEDGTAIVGLSEGFSGAQAYRWTEDDDMVGLGWLPGAGGFSTATALSADGSIVGGQSQLPGGGWGAVYWDGNGNIHSIPSIIPSANIANAVTGVSGDGAVLVGYNTGTNPSHNRQFIWDAANGARNLQTALEEEFGVDLKGWDVGDTGRVVAISSEGNAVVGFTTHPDLDVQWGYIAYFEPPVFLVGDLDGNGAVDVFDLLELLAQWGPCESTDQCEGFCFSQAPSGCWCDDTCFDTADCCAGACDHCALDWCSECPGDDNCPSSACPADLDGSGGVDVFDLLELLANWG